tara:strand:+ start:216 stop:524 length:309 start_codon:yes stop_codon:yes gene_type:complete
MVNIFKKKEPSSEFESTGRTLTSKIFREKPSLDSIKKKETFVPYLHERGNAGRSEIDSVKNILIKEGTMGKMKHIEQEAKLKYRHMDALKIKKNSLKGLGIF